jgi:hypothetical protein
MSSISGAQRGLEGGVGGVDAGGQGQCPQKKKFFLGKCDTYLRKHVMYLGGFFSTWFLSMVFYFWLRN